VVGRGTAMKNTDGLTWALCALDLALVLALYWAMTVDSLRIGSLTVTFGARWLP
jgi:hypothetical protein